MKQQQTLCVAALGEPDGVVSDRVTMPDGPIELTSKVLSVMDQHGHAVDELARRVVYAPQPSAPLPSSAAGPWSER